MRVSPLKPINTSVFDFTTLIRNGCVYVDKTAQIYEIAKPSADRICFFPCPRRFGKSLLLVDGYDAPIAGLLDGEELQAQLPKVRKALHDFYVFEFKFKSAAKAAIRQCRERNCAAAFAGDKRPVYYVGVNYSPRKNQRTVNDVRCEPAAG